MYKQLHVQSYTHAYARTSLTCIHRPTINEVQQAKAVAVGYSDWLAYTILCHMQSWVINTYWCTHTRNHACHKRVCRNARRHMPNTYMGTHAVMHVINAFCIYAWTHTRTNTAVTHTHTRTHARTHAHTHTYTHREMAVYHCKVPFCGFSSLGPITW